MNANKKVSQFIDRIYISKYAHVQPKYNATVLQTL